jgi:apolipoprotein N-acyltransferase
MSLPPLGWWPLAWLAAIPWAWLIVKPRVGPIDTLETKLSANRAGQGNSSQAATARSGFFARLCRWPVAAIRSWLGQIWLANFLLWLATLYFLPLPHPALWVAWPLLSAYLAVWNMGALASAHMLAHRWRIPITWALPISWMTMEWFRSWVFTGFAMALLGHSQYQLPLVIQIADLGGAYLVGFVMVLFGSAVAGIYTTQTNRWRWGHLLLAAATISLIVGYGNFRLAPSQQSIDQPSWQAAIIQGSIDTEFPSSVEEARAILQKQWDEYYQLTQQALSEHGDLQLVIWPETALLQPDYFDRNEPTPLPAEQQLQLEQMQTDLMAAWRYLTSVPQGVDGAASSASRTVPLLSGIHAYAPRTDEHYNAAVLIDAPGQIMSRYLKNHRVLFGEYIPLADRFPWLDRISPIGKSLSPGKTHTTMTLQGIRFLPSICFESTVPHLIRRHVRAAQRGGERPDILLNLTNDGWFFGTSCLDLHLACNVFRAVETRCHVWVAANTGLSAEINAEGMIQQLGPRRQTGILVVAPRRARGDSPYMAVGDIGCWLVATLVCGGWLLSWRRQRAH